MDLDSLYEDLLKSYTKTKARDNYITDAKKVAEYLSKNQKTVNDLIESNTSDTTYIPYPEHDDKDFNKKIFRKKEFNRHFELNAKEEYKSGDFDIVSQSKCSQTNFKLTPNQKFIKNFMSPLTPYNGLLLFHSVGVGKTCTAISIAEQYHKLHQKPALVILTGTLVDNFKKQIFDITKYDIMSNKSNLCTGTSYPDMILDKSYLDKVMKPDVLEKLINKIISQRYHFIGFKKLVIIYQQLREKVMKQEKDASKHEALFQDKLKEFFSDRLIIIDEAHRLRTSTDKTTKQSAAIFYSILKHTENVKLVLLTATPMFNNANEIVWLLNLLLTNDKRPNLKSSDIFDKLGTLTTNGRKKLIEAARGYVSYMRGENPFTFPFRLYPSINNDPKVMTKFPSLDITSKKIKEEDKIRFLEIVGSQMSDYQKAIYTQFKRRVIIDENDDDVDVTLEDLEKSEDMDKLSNDLHSIHQISNIVYPVSDIHDPMEARKAFGKSGFESTFVNTARKGIRYRYSNECLSKHGEILSYNKLHQYAAKMKSVIDYIINSKGIVFVYSRYYPAGVVPLAIALEHIGFTKYNANNITGENITVDDKFKGRKRPSYVIISSKNELSPNNDKEIEMAKSKENADGDIIKVVLATSVAAEGIDFKRMREVHILEPWYNLNLSEQIVGRALRTCSHIDMPKEKRNVTIYFHAAKYNEVEESIDVRTYRVAEKKQKRITEVERVMKESSLDCNLNKNSLTYNVKDLNMNIPLITSQGTYLPKYDIGDRDFTYVCNYAKCELKCDPDVGSILKTNIDESTYDTRFIMDDVTLYQRYIAELYTGVKKAFTYGKILTLLQSSYKVLDEEVLQYALQAMLDDKTSVYDSEQTRGYLIYRSNKYIFQSAHSNDKRLTIEQREIPSQVKTRIKLDMMTLKQHLEKDQGNIVSLGSKSNKGQKETVVEHVYDNVCEHIQQLVADTKSAYQQQGVSLAKYERYLVDSAIDRLGTKNITKLVQEIAALYNENKMAKASETAKSCLRSMIEADIFIIHDEKIKYFYNHYDGDLYCIRSDGDFKKCSPLDLSKVTKEVNELKKKMNNYLEESVKGHIEVTDKAGECDFKVRDNPKSSGYVCWKTSALSLSDLRDRITLFDSKLSLENMIKKDMCLLYELTLRAQGKKVFKRSLVKKLK